MKESAKNSVQTNETEIWDRTRDYTRGKIAGLACPRSFRMEIIWQVA
jgi:hypothetical protein